MGSFLCGGSPRLPHTTMTNTMRNGRNIHPYFLALCFVMLSAPITAVKAQTLGGTSEKGWTLYESFQGSSDSAGVVTRTDTTLGYDFNRYFSVDAGIPVYFIHASNSTSGLSSTSGIGNFYVDLRLTAENRAVTFVSNLRGSAPTGDQSKGLSTGHGTYDWTNHFDHAFGHFVPYAELGVANTVTDTPYYLRPFSSFGTVGHFEAGLGVRVSRYFRVSAAAYDIAASGEQTLYSRFMRQGSGSPAMPMGLKPLAPAAGSGSGSGSGSGGNGRVYETAAVTTGSSDLGSDNGFFAGVNVFPNRFVDLNVGYSRSVHYREDGVYFGFGVNIASLWKRARQP